MPGEEFTLLDTRYYLDYVLSLFPTLITISSMNY